MTAFDRAVAAVLDVEGVHGYDDAGGDTWYGIARKFHPRLEPWPPSRDQAIEVYRQEYWLRHRCQDLPPMLGRALFDAVVNQPAGSIIEEFQRAVRSEPDGVIGEDTIAAANRLDQNEVLALFFARRALRYADKSEPQYRVGLVARLFRMQRAILGG
jgi:lysozyme family protein